MNRATLIGRLGDDPEIKNLRDGGRLCRLSIATSMRWKTRDGEKKEKTEWHRIVIWNEGLVDVADQYLRKGDQVFIEGRIETEKYEDKDGVEKYSTQIVLSGFDSKIELLDNGGGKRNDRDDRDNRRGDSRDDRRGSDRNNDGRNSRSNNDDRRGDTRNDRRDDRRDNGNNEGYSKGGKGSYLDDEIPF